MGGGTQYRAAAVCKTGSSIHPPCGGRDPRWRSWRRRQTDFNPPALWGAGPDKLPPRQRAFVFQSTRPGGGGTTFTRRILPWQLKFQSTRPVEGGTVCLELRKSVLGISIHPPCGGRDAGYLRQRDHAADFNPPALWGAGRANVIKALVGTSNFNPPALWGAGLIMPFTDTVSLYFNPPALWGAGLLFSDKEQG